MALLSTSTPTSSSTTGPTVKGCKPYWMSRPHSDYCYGGLNLCGNWHDCHQICLGLGADLVSIHNSKENDFVNEVKVDKGVTWQYIIISISKSINVLVMIDVFYKGPNIFGVAIQRIHPLQMKPIGHGLTRQKMITQIGYMTSRFIYVHLWNLKPWVGWLLP